MNKLLKLAVFCILLAFVCIGTAEAKRVFQPAKSCNYHKTIDVKNRSKPVSGTCVYEVRWEDDETGESGVRYVFEDSNYGAGYVDEYYDKDGKPTGNYWTPTPYPRNTILSKYGEPIIQVAQSMDMNQIIVNILGDTKEQFDVSLYDLNGQRVDVSLTKTDNQIIVNSCSLSSGSYFIALSTENEVHYSKILIVR